MRIVSRVILTVTGLSVLAVGWRAGEAPFVAADAQAAAPTVTASTQPTGPVASSTTPADQAQSTDTAPSATPTATPTQPTDASAAASGTYAGPAINTRYGTLQVQLVVEAGVVTDVQTLQGGQNDPHSQRINARAIPALVSEVLESQTWDVAYVSGASYTSEGILESVQGALSDAGLA